MFQKRYNTPACSPNHHQENNTGELEKLEKDHYFTTVRPLELQISMKQQSALQKNQLEELNKTYSNNSQFCSTAGGLMPQHKYN